jgi:hypothetical protein
MKNIKKTIIVIAAGLSIFTAGVVVSASTAIKGYFTDSGWWSASAEWAKDKGLMNGLGDGKFGGDETLTRGQLAQVMKNMSDKELFVTKMLLGRLDTLEALVLPPTQVSGGHGQPVSEIAAMKAQIAQLQHDLGITTTMASQNKTDLERTNRRIQILQDEARLPYIRGTKIVKANDPEFTQFIQNAKTFVGANVSGGVSQDANGSGTLQVETDDVETAIAARDRLYVNYRVYNIRIHQNATNQFFIYFNTEEQDSPETYRKIAELEQRMPK